MNSKGGGLPGIGSMAGGAVCRYSQRYVIWIRTLVIIRRMTTHATGRRAGIPGSMTFETGRRQMRPRQGKTGLIMVESGRRPGCYGMATGTVFRKLRGGVIGVGRLVVIRRMATRTIRRRAGISGSMAVEAGRIQMCAHQWEFGLAVVKAIVLTPGWVAGQAGRTAVRITIHAVVVIIRFRVLMASDTSKFRVIRRIRMAVGTLIPFPFMRAAVYGEIFRIVLRVFCRHPIQIRCMALYTIL